MKIRFKRKEKKQLTYAEAHNKAFWAFHKSSRILIWAGVLNMAGLLITLLQGYIDSLQPQYFIEGTVLFNTLMATRFNYSLGFSIDSLFNRLIEMQSLADVWFVISIIAIAIVMSAFSIMLGVFASQGKKIALFGGTAFYLLDFVAIIGCYLLGEPSIYLWIMFGLHIVILFFLLVAIFEYYNLFTIEKIYKKD
jgi:hypothetical protein